MKAPGHPVPSGDREMARLLLLALAHGGHEALLPCELRTYSRDSDAGILARLRDRAAAEIARLVSLWQDPALRPDAWLTYHVYYKSPDLVGPAVTGALGIPYLIAEASWSGKRNKDGWRAWQREAERAFRAAKAIFTYTEQDRAGLGGLPLSASMLSLPPFIDAAPPAALPRQPGATARLAASAMMRAGNKLESYLFLAQALLLLTDQDWQLTIIGDGPERRKIEQAFAIFQPGQISFTGQLGRDKFEAHLASADLFVWPGVTEAYGMVYLEAQAAGTPVVALASGGTASTFVPGVTGVLVSPCTPQAYADAIAGLLRDQARRIEMGCAAARFVLDERTVAKASAILDEGLRLAGAG